MNIHYLYCKGLRLALMAACTLMAACKNTEPDISYGKGDTSEDYTAPIYVSLRPQDMFTTVATRGTGSFTPKSIGLKAPAATFRVLAFRNGTDTDEGLNDAGDFSVAAKDDSNGAYCLLGGDKTTGGQAARLVNDSTGAMDFIDETTGEKKRFFYSQKYPNAGYDFFAYYIDKRQQEFSALHYSKSRVYIDLTVDGAQDVLVGTAPALTESLIKQRYGKLNVPADARKRISSIGKYSTVAARYDIQPVIHVKHALTKIRFEAIAADSSAEQVCIKGITLTGCNGGKLVVADTNGDSIGLQPDPTQTATLTLREPSPDGITPGDYAGKDNRYQMQWADSLAGYTLMERPAVHIGESLMMPPAESYKMGFDFLLTHPDKYGNLATGDTHLYHTDYIITAPQDNEASYDKKTGKHIFQAGYEYVIRIACYGYKDCEVSTSPSGWIKSEDINIDPEKDEKQYHTY